MLMAKFRNNGNAVQNSIVIQSDNICFIIRNASASTDSITKNGSTTAFNTTSDYSQLLKT